MYDEMDLQVKVYAFLHSSQEGRFMGDSANSAPAARKLDFNKTL